MPNKEAKLGKVTQDEKEASETRVKRPLVPVVLAFMLGLAGAAWGLQVPRFWLIAVLAVLLVVLFLLYFLKTFRSLHESRKDQQ